MAQQLRCGAERVLICGANGDAPRFAVQAGMPLSIRLAIAVSAGVAAGVFAAPSLPDRLPWIVVLAGVTAIAAHARNRKDLAQWPTLVALPC